MATSLTTYPVLQRGNARSRTTVNTFGLNVAHHVDGNVFQDLAKKWELYFHPDQKYLWYFMKTNRQNFKTLKLFNCSLTIAKYVMIFTL
jgi:hypothetical protein